MEWREWLTLVVGSALWVTFFVLVTAGILVWFRARREFSSAEMSCEEALAILDQRVEAGEISRDEYEAIRRDLLS